MSLGFIYVGKLNVDTNFVERQAQHRSDRLKKSRTGSVGTDRLGH